MEKRRLFTGILFIFLILAGCTAVNGKQEIPSPAVAHPQSEHKSKQDMDVLIIATGDMSGVYFSLGQAIAAMYEKYDGVAWAAQVTNASFQNVDLVSKKKADLGFATVDVFSEMAEDDSIPNLRVLTELYSNYIQIVTLEHSGISSFKDLEGKRIGVGPDKSGTKLAAERILSAFGLDDNKVEKHFLTFTQSADALRNGTIDAAFFSSGLPNPEIASLASQMPITLIPVPEEIVSKLNKEHGNYSENVIAPDIYEGVNEGIQTVSVKNVLLTHKDFPEKEAYQLVNTLYKHLPELQKIHPAAQDIIGTEAKMEIPIDFHPGAKKFFQKRQIPNNEN
ncbi:TAXI family TRAP transporter solute-binding subunit [Siminovitchia terrae]|uniref:TAXI family TRAP transporter solute-binding subunit n=1 Tax=Siminovitchia terrae TaxID=1914933 RepID=UPI00136D1643|nr:TAXI family TRAP transporter solute-binding subunit [Siminovitchia terrae]